MSQSQEQKAKAFEAALNRHGFALQYAVAQSARDLARFEWSNWFPFVPEFPVRVQGADTTIDLILQHRMKPSYLVVETKRANPALAYWCFAKSGLRGEWAYNILYSEILRKVGGQFFTEVRHGRAVDAIYDVAVEAPTGAKGDERGSRSGAIGDAVGQVCRGLNGLIEYFQLYGIVDMAPLEFFPVVVTTANSSRPPSPSQTMYMIDEDNQPILPKYVETGPGAEKLRAFKEHLKKRHVVSFYTTPEDRRARILHDVPALLKAIGAEISDHIVIPEAPADTEVLQQFERLPKMFAGIPVTIEFVNDGDFRSAFAEECAALGLEAGACVFAVVTLSTGSRVRIFGERDVALTLCRLPKHAKVQAPAITALGAYKRVEWTDDGPMTTPEVETGLIVKEIITTETKGARSVEPGRD